MHSHTRYVCPRACTAYLGQALFHKHSAMPATHALPRSPLPLSISLQASPLHPLASHEHITCFQASSPATCTNIIIEACAWLPKPLIMVAGSFRSRAALSEPKLRSAVPPGQHCISLVRDNVLSSMGMYGQADPGKLSRFSWLICAHTSPLPRQMSHFCRKRERVRCA